MSSEHNQVSRHLTRWAPFAFDNVSVKVEKTRFQLVEVPIEVPEMVMHALNRRRSTDE